MPIFSSEAGDLGRATALTSISLVGKTWLTACVFICNLTFLPWRHKTNFCRDSISICPDRRGKRTCSYGKLRIEILLPVRWFRLEAHGAAILVAAQEPNAHWRRQLKKVRIAFT